MVIISALTLDYPPKRFHTFLPASTATLFCSICTQAILYTLTFLDVVERLD
jgi:hypothetical protein